MWSPRLPTYDTRNEGSEAGTDSIIASEQTTGQEAEGSLHCFEYRVLESDRQHKRIAGDEIQGLELVSRSILGRCIPGLHAATVISGDDNASVEAAHRVGRTSGFSMTQGLGVASLTYSKAEPRYLVEREPPLAD